MQSRKLLFLASFSLMFLLVASFAIAAGQEKITSHLLQQYETRNVAPVTVYLKSTGSAMLSKSDFNAVVKRAGASKVTQQYYPDGFVAELTRAEVLNLAKDARVASIEYAFTFKPNLQDAVVITGAKDTWEMKVNDVPLTGLEQSVCVVDTGVDFAHPDLAAKNVLGCNLDCFNTLNGMCRLDCDVNDELGHGTHVGGIVGAAGGINGISPGVNIISLKVYNGSSGSFQGTIGLKRAVEWCINNSDQYNIHTISMSLGTGQLFSSECDGVTTLDDVINAAANLKGISTVAAAGNDLNNTAILLPACLKRVIAVGATNKDDTVASYSNYNQLVKLFAPGTDINSTAPGKYGFGYVLDSGTSMSTPMVSASIAILNQFIQLSGSPKRTPEEFEQLLYASGDPILDLPSDFVRINIHKAMLSLDVFAPEVSLTSPLDGTVMGLPTKKPIDLDFTCLGLEGWNELDKISFTLNEASKGQVYTEERDIDGKFTEQVFNVKQLGLGKYTWNCEATDTLGNKGTAPKDYGFEINSGLVGDQANKITPDKVIKAPK